MFLGFLMIGMAGGLVAGSTALMMGQTIWLAMLVYALTGVAGTFLGALTLLSPRIAEPDFPDSGHLAVEG